jgi:hypothetical protein
MPMTATIVGRMKGAPRSATSDRRPGKSAAGERAGHRDRE